MHANKEKFTRLINGSKQFTIPIFQRDYCWNREQCADLWNAVISASNRNNSGGHFMGSIVHIEADDSGGAFQKLLVIDGQQRITTLTLLLIALRNCIKKSEWSGGEDSPTLEKIDRYFLINPEESGLRRYKLMLRRADNATLQYLVDGGDFSDLGSSHSELVQDAYKFFVQGLEEPRCNFDVIYRGIGFLEIVDVKLHREADNPQLVFESMNSTGVDLTQSDLVRNYLLMGLNEPEQTQLYEKYWSTIETSFRTSRDAFDCFLRDYIALKTEATKQTRADRIYDAFKKFWNPSINLPLNELLEDMTRVARTYASFRGTASMQRPWLAGPMKNMRSLSTVQGLVIMRLYDCHEKGFLSQSEFVQAIELIESYLLRRAILGLQTRGYWSLFARLAHEIDNQAPFRSLRVALARLSDNNRFPSDDEFSRALQELDLYNLQVCKHIFDRLENADQKEPSRVHEFSIEHVMPQSIDNEIAWQEMLGDEWMQVHSTWQHRLGNLTLTAYNSAYSNRPFHEKKEIEGGFRQSAVRLNEYIRDQARWTEAEMQERGVKLARRALEIWANNEVDEADIQEAQIRDLRKRASQRNVDNLDVSKEIRKLLDKILEEFRKIGDFIEVIERKSVCCYGPQFFAEILPMGTRLRLLLPLDFSEAENPNEISIEDCSSWKFVSNRMHDDCDLLIDITHEDQISAATPMIRQALDRSRGGG